MVLQKQVTDVSLVLNNSDIELENLSSLCFLYQMARKQTVQKVYHL